MTPRPWLVAAALLALAGGTAAAEQDRTDKPWLGISYQSSGAIGITVTNVFEESGALASGLRAGDEIFQVEDVTADILKNHGLSPIIESLAVGDRVTMQVYREGRVLTLRPKLSRRMSDSELLHVQLVGKRAPAFSLINPLDPDAEPIDDSILAGKVGVLTRPLSRRKIITV